MTEDDITALAAALPAWKVFQRFYPGVEVASTQADAEAPEVMIFPDGFDPPDDERMAELKRELAREILSTRYQQDRAAAYLPQGDTLDGILKGLEAINAQGFELPPDTLRVVQHWREVKTNHPKPEGVANA